MTVSRPGMTNDLPPALQRLLAEEPFVRLLARTLLAEEADEVVQRTWLAAVQHGGDGVDRPRSWLARIARNVATNLLRDRRRRRIREGEGETALPVPSSAELLQREERRRELVAAVDALPEPLRAVVLLRWFEGLPPREIAARSGLPVETVWNRLRRALQLLRAQLDAEHGGDRRAWLLPLVPFAARGELLPATAATASVAAVGVAAGVMAMTMKTKLAAAFAAMLAVAGLWTWWANLDPASAGPPPATLGAAEVAVGDLGARGRATTADTEVPQRTALVSATATTMPSETGSLIVRVRHGDDGSPAVGVALTAVTPGENGRNDGTCRVTGADGVANFAALTPTKRLWVCTPRAELPASATIRAGETTELDLQLPVGLRLTGIVVDATGTPVAGALVEVAPLGQADVDAEVLAVTGPDGRFVVRGAPTTVLAGARADGHSASPMVFVLGKGGNEAEVRLQLGPPAGSVHGIVVDPSGRPIRDAIVKVGVGSRSGIVAREDGAPPLPAAVRSGDEGTFVAIGVPTGSQPVSVWARGYAPWTGTVEITAHLAAPLRVVLGEGARLRGVVRRADGTPARGVDVQVGTWHDLTHRRRFTAVDGAFEFDSLPAGEVAFVAQHDEWGRVEHRVPMVTGEVTECEVTLSRGLELAGRITDAAGAPIPDAGIMCHTTEPTWSSYVRTDREGRFTVINRPVGRPLHLDVQARGFAERRHQVPATEQKLALVLDRAAAASARITGCVQTEHGTPLANVEISAFQGPVSTGLQATGPDGRFEVGPLVPGTWKVRIEARDLPAFHSGPHAIEADTTCDLGTILLVAGGDARLVVDGKREGLVFRIADAALLTWSAPSDRNGKLMTRLLAPGDHLLFVSGPAVAAQVIPFVVRSGATTEIHVHPSPGVRQLVELTPVSRDRLPEWVDVRAIRGDALVAYTAVALQAGETATGELCLAPGDYTFVVLDQDREVTRAPFTIGASEGPPLRLTLP